MNRFSTTLCLSSLSTHDGVEYKVSSSGASAANHIASVGGTYLDVSNVLPRALPSRVASSIADAMRAAPSFSHSTYILFGTGMRREGLGNTVVETLVHQLSRTISAAAGATFAKDRYSTSASQAYFVECMLFASDGAAVVCETVTEDDDECSVRSVLGSSLAGAPVSLAVFKFTDRTAIFMIHSHLTAAHMAALLLSSYRHVFLYAHASITAQEIVGAVQELRVLRGAFAAIGKPCNSTTEGGVADVKVMLNALAHSEDECLLLETALKCYCSAATTTTTTTRGVPSTSTVANVELEETRTELRRVRKQLEALEMEKRSSAEVIRRLRVEAASASPAATSAETNFDTVGTSETVEKLRLELKAAQEGRRFVEEKLRLLEVRASMTRGRSPSSSHDGFTTAGTIGPIREASNHVSSTALATTPTRLQPAEVELLRQEHLSLAADYKQREEKRQEEVRSIREKAEVAEARARRLEDTVRAQSEAIVEAKRAILAERAEHERELDTVLRRVRSVSQQRSRSSKAGSQYGQDLHTSVMGESSQPSSVSRRQSRYQGKKNVGLVSPSRR